MKSVKFTKTDLSILLQVKNIVKENNVRYIKISKHDCLYKDTNGKVVYFEVNIKKQNRNRRISFNNNDNSENDVMDLDLNENFGANVVENNENGIDNNIVESVENNEIVGNDNNSCENDNMEIHVQNGTLGIPLSFEPYISQI